MHEQAEQRYQRTYKEVNLPENNLNYTNFRRSRTTDKKFPPHKYRNLPHQHGHNIFFD
jgi:hypothetical protein